MSNLPKVTVIGSHAHHKVSFDDKEFPFPVTVLDWKLEQWWQYLTILVPVREATFKLND